MAGREGVLDAGADPLVGLVVRLLPLRQVFALALAVGHGQSGAGIAAVGDRGCPTDGGFTVRLREAGLGGIGDLGFTGLDDDPDVPVIVTGRKAVRNHLLTAPEKEANKLVWRAAPPTSDHGFPPAGSCRNTAKPGPPTCGFRMQSAQ